MYYNVECQKEYSFLHNEIVFHVQSKHAVGNLTFWLSWKCCKHIVNILDRYRFWWHVGNMCMTGRGVIIKNHELYCDAICQIFCVCIMYQRMNQKSSDILHFFVHNYLLYKRNKINVENSCIELFFALKCNPFELFSWHVATYQNYVCCVALFQHDVTFDISSLAFKHRLCK